MRRASTASRRKPADKSKRSRTPPIPSCLGPKKAPVTSPASPPVLEEGVATHLDRVAEVAISPPPAAIELHAGEIELSAQVRQIDGEAGIADHHLPEGVAPSNAPLQAALPDNPPFCARSIGGSGPGGPGLRQAVPGKRRRRIPHRPESPDPPNVKRRLIPGPEILRRYFFRLCPGPESVISREQRLPIYQG